MPIHYTTFMGLRWRLRVVYSWASLLLRPFKNDFWSKIWPSHVTCKQGVAGDPIFEFPDPDLPVHYTTFVGLRWRLRVASPLLRPFDAKFSKPRRKSAKKLCFLGKWGQNVKFCFRDPQKAHPCTKRRHLKIGAGVLAVGWQKNQKTSQVTRGAFSHMWWAKGGTHIFMKFYNSSKARFQLKNKSSTVLYKNVPWRQPAKHVMRPWWQICYVSRVSFHNISNNWQSTTTK